MFTLAEKVMLWACLVGGVLILRGTNKAIDRWEADMKEQVKLINERTKLAQQMYGGETK